MSQIGKRRHFLVSLIAVIGIPCGGALVTPAVSATGIESLMSGTRIGRDVSHARKKGGHKPILNTPHAVIRKMMGVKNCWRCGGPLQWAVFGYGKTPHLHHDHKNGEPLGFAHPRCNSYLLELEIERLKAELFQLRAQEGLPRPTPILPNLSSGQPH